MCGRGEDWDDRKGKATSKIVFLDVVGVGDDLGKGSFGVEEPKGFVFRDERARDWTSVRSLRQPRNLKAGDGEVSTWSKLGNNVRYDSGRARKRPFTAQNGTGISTISAVFNLAVTFGVAMPRACLTFRLKMLVIAGCDSA